MARRVAVGFLIAAFGLSPVCAAPEKSPAATGVRHRRRLPLRGARLITTRSVGPIRLGMTLSAVRRLLPGVVFTREPDGDGVAWIAVNRKGRELALVLTSDDDTADTSINVSKPITTIQVFNADYKTAAGVGPKTPLRTAVRRYGKAHIQWSEIEAREFASFSRGPRGMTFRIAGGSGSPAGIYGKKTGPPATTWRYHPQARVLSILIGR